jgi:single-stranded DNA-binding protein
MEGKDLLAHCVVYGGYASFAAKLSKGTHIVIEGDLTHREYNRMIETASGAINVSWPITGNRGGFEQNFDEEARRGIVPANRQSAVRSIWMGYHSFTHSASTFGRILTT